MSDVKAPTKFRVLVTDRFDDEAFASLSNQPLISPSKSMTPDLVDDHLSLIDALAIRSRTQITSELLGRAPNLKIIVTATSGFDHIDLVACAARNVKVMFTPTANAASACELTWGLLIAASRKMILASAAVQTGNWRRDELMGSQFFGKTLGIIGLGRIGWRVARVAHAFGMTTLAHDPYKDDAYFQEHDCARVPLAQIFETADVITCHVPASAETTHMISRELLKSAKPGLIFVNTSRGSAISDKCLIESLDQRWISACGLDVFETEPLPTTSGLINRPNVVLSPHIGATTNEAFKAASQETADKIIAFAERGMSSDSLP